MADRKITPELKSRQSSKWSWPHLASVQDRKSGFQSPDRPSSWRSVSDKSQKSPGLTEHKTPSQTSLPRSAIPSETSSIKSMGIADDYDPNVDQSFRNVHKPSSLSSRSSLSISSGHGTIRAEESQSEQISPKVEEGHLEEKVSIGVGLNSEIDIQNNHKAKPVRGQQSGFEGVIQKSRNPHSYVKIPQEKGLNSEGEIQKIQDPLSEGEIQKIQDPHSDVEIPQEKGLNSEGKIQKIQDPHSDVEIPQEKGLNSEGKIQKIQDPRSDVKISKEEGLNSEREMQKMQDPRSDVKIPQEKGLDSEGKIQKIQDPHSNVKIPQEKGLNSEGEIQKIQDSHPDVKIPQEKGLDSEKIQNPHSDVEIPQDKGFDSEREIQSDNDLHVRWKQPIGDESGPEEKIRRGHDPYLESKSQEAKGLISEKAKAAEESGSEIEFGSEGEPRSEENLQRADGQRLKEMLRRTSNIRRTINNREIQPIASEVPQEGYFSAIDPSKSEDPDPVANEHNVSLENLSDQAKDLQGTRGSSVEVELPESESTGGKVTIKLPHPFTNPTKSRKIQIPEIFVQNPSHAKDTNIPKPIPNAPVPKKSSQGDARDIDVPNPVPKVYVFQELSLSEAGKSDAPDSAPKASVHNELSLGESSDINTSGSVPKVSVFKELSQDEPWWPDPLTPMVDEVKDQDKSWSLMPSTTKPWVRSEAASNPNEVHSKTRAPRGEPVSKDIQGQPKVKRRKLYLRKVRNAAARRVILKITLGRELATRTKPALRKLANGETITPDPQF